jgi:hypothetical protein
MKNAGRSDVLDLSSEAITMAGRVGREVRLIFAERTTAERFMDCITKGRDGWKPSDSFMSPRPSTPWGTRERRRRIKPRA